MTAKVFAELSGFKAVCMPSPDKKVDGVYIGDLLSWVMGKAEQGNVWITIMSNLNIVAVAALADTSLILLSEGVEADESLVGVANSKGVNILSTSLSSYEAAIKVNELLR